MSQVGKFLLLPKSPLLLEHFNDRRLSKRVGAVDSDPIPVDGSLLELIMGSGDRPNAIPIIAAPIPHVLTSADLGGLSVCRGIAGVAGIHDSTVRDL